MKTFKRTLYFVTLCLALVLSGCSNDDDNNPDPNNTGNNGGGGEFFRAKVDGTDFAASTDPASLIGGAKSTNGGTTVLNGQGSTNSGDFINFTIVGYNGTGTYQTANNMTNANILQYGELNGSSASVWSSNLATAAAGISPGEINVTVDADGVVEGTFSFEGYNAADMSTKNITQGEFKFNID